MYVSGTFRFGSLPQWYMLSSSSSNESWAAQVDVEIPDAPNVVEAPTISYASSTKKNLPPDQDVELTAEERGVPKVFVKF